MRSAREREREKERAVVLGVVTKHELVVIVVVSDKPEAANDVRCELLYEKALWQRQ